MTRPWFGVLPPPRGHGYYPDEYGMYAAREYPAYFAPKPPLTRGDLHFDPAPDIDGLVRDELRRVMDSLRAGLDAATTQLVVEYLRAMGYTITEPEYS
ncbi:hypothetical protein [Microbacterium jejuense]|uniref:hypothetical protein n=1 Tax=Microbacterium jejuense TaxID=1263637 RepID=UPI0031EE7D98